MLIKNEDILQILGKNLKQARKDLKYTQEFVSEGVNISIDLLRNIENVGSVPTLLNLCNFLKISPNKLFDGLLTFREETLDSTLTEYLKAFSPNDRKVFRDIIIHVDKNY